MGFLMDILLANCQSHKNKRERDEKMTHGKNEGMKEGTDRRMDPRLHSW